MNANRLDKGGILQAGIQKTAAGAPPAVPDDLNAARLFFISMAVLAAAALPQFAEHGANSGQVLGGYSLKWLGLLGLTGLIALVCLTFFILLLTGARHKLSDWASTAQQFLSRRRGLAVLGALAVWAVYVMIVFYRFQKHFAETAPQVWLFFLAVGAGAFLLSALWKNPAFFWVFLMTTLLYGAGTKALGYLPDISTFPFSLSWSEGSRYYYASLFHAPALYGMDIPLSTMHPTRYLMQGLAFFAPGAGIAFHRFWQVALWLSFSLLTGYVLARRFRAHRPAVMLAVTLWAALFLLQGPVYYHLLVIAALVLAGFDRDRFWKTMAFVIAASLWAGISRVNWIPVPAMLAVTLYLLEEPVCASQQHAAGKSGGFAVWARYLRQPFAWSAAGLAAALASQAAYVLISGHEDISQFGSSFTSALLWYRLLPSPTFPMGVIPAVLLVSAPLLVLIIANWVSGRAHWHPLRIVGISLMLLVLFAGGLVVSTKIGGGSNLHNMDAYLTLLMTVGTAIAFGRFSSETGGWARIWNPWPLVAVIVLVPVIWNLNIGTPFARRNLAQASYDLGKLNETVQAYAAEGEVLFITQRQLTVFGLIPGVRVVPDYELVTLTEMSMANNRYYLDRFYNDLRSHRFALIVADRQHTGLRDPARNGFAEENNAWVENVSQHILNYYDEETYFDTQGISLLVPKQ